nr:MAG TPA: hypothetical protein [Bacteriophage sp.]
MLADTKKVSVEMEFDYDIVIAKFLFKNLKLIRNI